MSNVQLIIQKHVNNLLDDSIFNAFSFRFHYSSFMRLMKKYKQTIVRYLKARL